MDHHMDSHFDWCLGRGWLLKSPARGVHTYEAIPKTKTCYLSDNEEERLLRACRDEYVVTVTAKRNAFGRKGGGSKDAASFDQTLKPPSYLYPMVLIAVRCGFRRGTVLMLRWRDIREDRWHIPPESIKSRETYEAPIPESVRAAISDYRKVVARECQDQEIPLAERLGSDCLVFNLSFETKVRKPFMNAVKRAKLSLTFHDLRRIFMNRLWDRGVSIDTAMALTGHRSLVTVMQHYRKVSDRELVEAVRLMERPREVRDGGTSVQ